MNEICFDLPWPPSANRYWRNFRGRMVISKEAREYRTRIGYQKSQLPQVKSGARLEINMLAYPPDRRKRDIDNLIKITLDALEKGLGFNDCQVDKLSIERKEVVENGLMNLKIREIKNESQRID